MRVGKSVAIVCAAMCACFGFAASAQNLIDPGQSVGAVPGFGGTGLAGLYYDNQNGFTSAAGSPPEASFTASNLCFPDCHGTLFDDSTGGLAAFTNGNAFNLNFFTSTEPVRLTWDGSEIVMSGYIAITAAGTYNFDFLHDDTISVTIGGVTNSFTGCCGDNTVSDTFTAPGLYRISIDFVELTTSSRFNLLGTDPSGNCILGCYDSSGDLVANDLFYSDTDLEGAPAPVIGSGWAAMAVTGLMGIEMTRRRRRI